MSLPTHIAPIACFIILSATSLGGNAQAFESPAPVDLSSVRTNTPSGLPVPRFVSLKSEKTFCRAGPTFAHKVRLTFTRRQLPLVVVAETRDHWRKVRDIDGDECWVHRSKLSGTKTAIVIQDELALYVAPQTDAPQKARLGRGLIARVDASKGSWIKVTTGEIRGWAQIDGLWGATQNRSID